MQNWLVEKGYKERWLLSLKGFNKGTVYENHPISVSPEMMPLDTSLFKDLHAGVCRHAAQTVLLPFGDPKKFSLATAKEVARAYLCLWDHTLSPNEGCPCSSRIVEDCTKFVSNITVIYDAKGIVVSEVGNRNGHHHDTAASIRQNNGGKQKKKSSLQHTPWVHTDAIDGLNVFIENTKRKLTIESPPIEEAQHSDEDGHDSDSDDDSIVRGQGK
jgi:hypothetical protein